MLPIDNTDFSATLIKAKAYKPNVLLNNMGGLDADQLHEAVRAVRHEEGHGARRRAVRDRKRQGGAEGGADRLVGHGMVVEPAERAGGA